jgi:hypothetical protein
MSDLDSIPHAGQIGLAEVRSSDAVINGPRVVRVEFFDEPMGFVHVVDVETNKRYRVYRHYFKQGKEK